MGGISKLRGWRGCFFEISRLRIFRVGWVFWIVLGRGVGLQLLGRGEVFLHFGVEGVVLGGGGGG